MTESKFKGRMDGVTTKDKPKITAVVSDHQAVSLAMGLLLAVDEFFSGHLGAPRDKSTVESYDYDGLNAFMIRACKLGSDLNSGKEYRGVVNHGIAECIAKLNEAERLYEESRVANELVNSIGESRPKYIC